MFNNLKSGKMALNQRLDLRQGQSLVMTPQLQQAIKLLQLSNFELQEYVEAEIEKNPLLETPDTANTDVLSSLPEPQRPSGEETPVTLPSEGEFDKTLENMGTDLVNVYADEASADSRNRSQTPGAETNWSLSGSSSGAASYDREGFSFENVLSEEKTLSEYLIEQLHLSITDPVKRMIGRHLIGTLNEAGYLGVSPTALVDQLGVDLETIEQTLEILQTFEPVGVFARDLQDCLKIQLEDKDRYDPVMATLLDNLDLLAKREFSKLKRLCRVDSDELNEMIAEIRDLNPKPGYAFGGVTVHPVIPDVIVRAAPDGTWMVELNTETLPKVLVNNQYYASVTASAEREKDKVYISECHSQATWLVKSLEQRARTILAVSREIVRQQDAFLVVCIKALKPLNLKDIADVIDMHESTVSRVTSNKYIETPRGIFELKYFFTNAITSTDGQSEYSAESIRYLIKRFIDEESPQAILSDDAIVEKLKLEGVDIARRTIAKYRESMKIPSSVQRRREKRP